MRTQTDYIREYLTEISAMNRTKNSGIPFEDILVVTSGIQRETIPTDAIFAEKGKSIVLGDLPWNLEEYTGPQTCTAILLRATVNIPESGFYALCGGADWWFDAWLDGAHVMAITGDCPPTLYDNEVMLELTAGKHTIDINFTRGDASALLAIGLQWCSAGKQFGVDLERQEGKLNPELHGSNTTLVLSNRALIKYDELFRRLNFTLTRTHDWALWNAGQRVVDTHFIFPLMKLDPADPTNYYFDATDEMIRLAQEEGKLKIFYRLGTSIEHTGKPHFNIIPPEDYEKYAEVLAGIVRHYTRGWANGFHYDIRYWEIWNEPDGSTNMWDAPYETFVPFFVTVLKRLKSEFPDLQFGGPAICSSSAAKFLSLLVACKEAGVEPDFLSWHCYTADAKNLVKQPLKIRYMLDNFGFTQTKLCVDEWHYLESWQGVQSYATPEEFCKAHERLHGIDSGVFTLAVLSGWQYTPLNMAMWYGSSWDSASWGYLDPFKQLNKNYYALVLFGEFLKEFTTKCHVDDWDNLSLLAATTEDGAKAGIIISDLKGAATTLEIPVKGMEKYSRISAVVLDDTRNMEGVTVERREGRLVLHKAKAGSAAFLVTLE